MEIPPGNENIPPSGEWIDERKKVDAEEDDKVQTRNRRWIVKRTGEIVLWGEGELELGLEKMRSVGQDDYTVILGGPVSPPPSDEFTVKTPGNQEVGKIIGVVSHKMDPTISPDIRAD